MYTRKKYPALPCLLALGLLSLVSPVTSQAAEQESNQTTQLRQQAEDMVVTATRSEESQREVPAKVEIIDSHDLEMTVGETITEQLKKGSSVSVIEYPGALAGIGIRGFRPEFSGITKHSLVLLNGRPAGATNLATILADNVERIEVLKGPASSLYGAEAMGGVVNVITKKNTDALTGNVKVGGGSFSTNFQQAALGGAVAGPFDFDINARRYDQQDDLTMGNGDKRANTSYRTQNASMRIGADIGPDWRADISANGYQGRDIETPGDIAYGETESGYKDIDNYGADIKVGGSLGASNKISLTAYHTGEESESYDNYSEGERVAGYRSYDSETTWDGVQVQDTHTWGAHTFIVGADYQYIEKTAKSYTAGGSRKAPASPDEARTNWAGYGESVWKFWDKRLTLTAGGRYDYFDVETLVTPHKTDFTPKSENFSTFTPRVGANYLFDNGLRLHSTLGQAFVPPSALQLAGYSERIVDGVTMTTKGNPDLDPETSTTWDGGFGFARNEWGLSMDVTYFYTKVDDRISTIQEGNVKTYVNSLDAEIQGLETMLSFDVGAVLGWEPSLRLYFNATNLFRAEEELPDGGMKDIHNVADYTYNYGIEYDDDIFDAKLHFRTVGPMRDTDWVTAGYPETEYPSFTVVDLVLGADFLEHHRLALTIDNLFDKNYYEKKGYPKPGRAFFVSYTFSF